MPFPLETVPDQSAPPAPTAESVLRPTLGRRLLFLWGALWAALVTIPASIVQVLSHRRTPTAANFRKQALWWGRAILGGAGIRVRVEDRARLDPEMPHVFVVNHQTGLDILALAAGLPYAFGFVAKAELASVPFLGAGIRNSASVFVDKRDARRAVQSVQDAGVQIRGGNSVLVFPEGIRSYQGGLLPFQRGAFMLALEAGVPLVPVTILGAYRLMDERRWLLRAGTVGIVVHPPLSLEGVTRRELPGVMERVRQTLADTLAAYEVEQAGKS